MTHRVLLTSAGIVVNHSHSTWEYSDADKDYYQAQTLAAYPRIAPISYVHMDHSSEVLRPTRRYNCWGFTFNPRQCWINQPTDVQNTLNANGVQVYAPNLRIGDVVCYRDANKVITHTGRVWSIDPSGQVQLVQSKWGGLGEYLHPVAVVPASYGTNVSYWRVIPLSGKGDAWHKDNLADDRLPYPSGIKWLSPDLWCSNTGGTTHENPRRGRQNMLYARLHNPDSLPINDANVRFYWADPHGGLPHSSWKDIGQARISVSPGTFAIAGPVAWTPDASIPEHCCILAIADTGDDPYSAATQDPLVWPYDIARDNNVVQRNISVLSVLPRLKRLRLPQFSAMNPFHVKMPVEVLVSARILEPRDLGELGLDLRAMFPTIARAAKSRAGRSRTVHPAPSIAVEALTKGTNWRTPGGRLSTRGKLLRTYPVVFGQGGHLNLVVRGGRDIRPGQLFRIDLEQRVGGATTGGMTYLIVVKEGAKRP